PRCKEAAGGIAPQSYDLVDEPVGDPDPEQVLAQRPALPARTPFEPERRELVRIAAEPLRHPILEGAPRRLDVVDQRLPEVEDHRADRFSTSQARATSDSVVRALPIASRSTQRPSSAVWERNASPLALTRSSISAFSSSDPSR